MTHRARISGGAAAPPPACYVTVYLDGAIVTSREPFDVNSIDPRHVAAIEFYLGAGQIPAQYNRLGSACGVLLIWTK